MKTVVAILVSIFFIFSLRADVSSYTNGHPITVYPEEYPLAIKNPLKGYRLDSYHKYKDYPYVTLTRDYIKWSDLDNDINDDLIASINDYTKRKWSKLDNTGVKVIPRIYLDWDSREGNEYWPKDMQTGDYSSLEFKKRIVRLIEAIGECWDNDPRVAWIQMGIIGYWGEHHNPHPSAIMQKILGNAFEKAFKNKHVLVRHPREFEDYKFGIYWDSWAHYGQTFKLMHGAGIEQLNADKGRWKERPIAGETAYNWGDYKRQPGDDPNDTLSDPVHCEFLIDTIRNLHCSALGWISLYDASDPQVIKGAEMVQRAFGYRFVLEKFSYTSQVLEGGTLSINLKIKNTGSAPFYYDWPVRISLLDHQSKQVVWSHPIDSIDIRDWLPGDDWDEENDEYKSAATSHHISTHIQLPAHSVLPEGKYIVALSIPDPGDETLGIRLAIKNYFVGDYHPLGYVGYGRNPPSIDLLDEDSFDDPMKL